MHTRHARKAKSAAADFVKRVISGHDSSPGPSSKPKSQIAKAKQAISKSDASRSPSRGRSPAASSKNSPAAKVAKGTKPSTSASAKASPAAKESQVKTVKGNETTKEPKDLSVEKGIVSKSAAVSIILKKSDKLSVKDTEINQVVPEIITIKSEDESDDVKETEKPKDNEKKICPAPTEVEIRLEEIKQEVEEAPQAVQLSTIETIDLTDIKEEISDQQLAVDQQVPVKRGRGRPRKVLKAGPVVGQPIVPRTSPEVKAVSTTLITSISAPLTSGKRPRGRPRKYPPGMTPAMYRSKALEKQQVTSPKIHKKAPESKYYSKIHKFPTGGGIGALTIKIKDDYMLQEGGMISPRHPTIMCEQDEFFKIFGLIKKSELDEMNRRTHTLHRAVGGKLRRLIKPKISPEMVYRNFMLNKSTAVGVVPDEWDSSDEYDDSSPMAKLVKSHSAPSTPAHRSLLVSPAKVSLLPKEKGLLTSLKPGQWSSPEEPGGMKKQWLKPPPKTPKRSSIEDALEAARENQKDISKQKKLEKPLLKKQKSDPLGKFSTKVVKLEAKSKSLDPGKSKCAAASSSYRFKPTGGFRPLAPPPKPTDEEEESFKPSRRSARNQGGKRKQWWHLLRANPDEYIPDHKWEEENAVKEKKKHERIQRRMEDGDDDEDEFMELEEDGEIEPGEVIIIPKPKKKKKKKILLTDEEIEILEAEERAMEERQKKEEKKCIKSPVKSALKRKLNQGAEGVPAAKLIKMEDSGADCPTSPSVIAKKKKKKKKKKLKENLNYHYMANVDGRGSVLTIHKGSKCKEYMIFDSHFNLVSVHNDVKMYQLTANSVVRLAKQEGWANLGQEVIEISLPNRMVKEKLRSRICERMAPTVVSAEEEKQRSCITPHMCQVCWINDHMYCYNMKRTGRNLIKGGNCLHYTLCSHYRHMSPKETYARYATVSQFGSGGITKNFSISRLKYTDFENSSKTLSEEGTSITISGGRLMAQGAKCESSKEPSVTITVNNAANTEVCEKNPPQKAEDLVCHEELGESDSEPSTPSGEAGKNSGLLTKHLWVRARQIAHSLGFKDIKEAMESLKENAEKSAIEKATNEDIVCVSEDEEEEEVTVQEYVEVELQEFSDSDSDGEDEEEISQRMYGVPLTTRVRACQPTTVEPVIKIHLMPVLERSRSKFYIKSKDRRVMKVQFGGRAEYKEEDQEWKVENDTYTMKDVTKKYQKKMIKLAKTKIGANQSAEPRSPPPKHVAFADSQEKGGTALKTATATSSGSPRVIWSSELNLDSLSPGRSKTSPEPPPAKKQKLNSGDSMATPKRKSEEEIGQGDLFRSPDTDEKIRNNRSAETSPCLSQGSAASFTSTSSAQGQQLLMASPVKLPKPSATVPTELQNHVSAGKDGSQTLTFTTKDIRQCKPELIQYIKSANLMDMIHKTLTEERNSIEKLLKDGDGDVSRLRDSLEQNECLLLAVKSESKEVKIKLVDFEMNVITEQNKAARLERRKDKLINLYNNAHKKTEAFKKAMERVEGLIQSEVETEVVPGGSTGQNVGYTVLKLPDGVSALEGAAVAGLNPVGGSTIQTPSGILTAASGATQLPGTVAMETIVQPSVSVVNL